MAAHDVVCARCWQRIGTDNRPLADLVAAHDCPELMRHRYCPECQRWTAVNRAGRLVSHYRFVASAPQSEPCPGSLQEVIAPRRRRRLGDFRPQET